MTQRQAMFTAFADVHNEFKQARARYKAQEASIKAALHTLDDIVISPAQGTLNKKHQVMRYLHAWQQQSQESRRAWRQRVEAYEDVNAFRDKVGDSFLLYVYGKVNAGKSSLGNFVATGQSQPESLPSGALRFGWQASSQSGVQEQSLAHGFGVDRSECTNAIQFFTLPGLTWVDSPGLHSTTTENGDLARSYAESSDMVVYLMNARNPGRESDNEELRLLLKLNKPLYIVISRSDRTEDDENDAGDIVKTFSMKSSASRKEQEQFVRQQVATVAAEVGVPEAAQQCKIISLSVGYAEQAQDAEAWEVSGMAAFFTAMAQMASSDSVRYKQQAPLERLRAFRRDLKIDAQSLAQSQQQMQTALENLQKEVEQTAERLQGRLTLRIGELANQESDDAYRNPQALSRKLCEDIAPEMQRGLEIALEEQLETFSDTMTRVMSIPEAAHFQVLEDYHKTYSHPGKSYAGELSALFTAIGSGVGWFVSGPKGAAFGANLGTQAGRAVGEMLRDDERIEKLYLGNNRYEVEAALVQTLDAFLRRHLQACYVAPVQEAVVSVRQLVHKEREALLSLESQLDAAVSDDAASK